MATKYGNYILNTFDKVGTWLAEVGALVPTMYVLSTDPNSYPLLRHSHKFGGKLSYLDYIK